MLISEPPIHVPPSLAKVFGFNEAAVIQEIHFWLNPNVSPHFSPYFKEGRYWIPDIFDQLYQKFFFWDEDTIAYMCAEFEQSGILMVLKAEDPSQNSDKITYHTLNYEILREMSGVASVPASSFVDDIPRTSTLDWESAVYKGTIFDKSSTFNKGSILGRESTFDGASTLDHAANENINMQSFFMAEIHKRGPDVYAMEVQDLPHFLACELLLEIQDRPKAEGRLPIDEQSPVENLSLKEALQKEAWDEPMSGGLPSREVICHFPKIDNDVQLKEFVWGDAILYRIVMVTFQMNILNQLFLFCETHKASKLVIFADNADELEIYQDFLAHKDKSKSLDLTGGKREEEKGEQTGIVIPVDKETLDIWAGFMKAVSIRFRQTLRDGQKTNPAIQHYLRFRPLSEF